MNHKEILEVIRSQPPEEAARTIESMISKSDAIESWKEEFGAVVWKLCMNSAVQGPTDENGVGPYLRHGEFVELDEYEVILKSVIRYQQTIKRLEQEVKKWKLEVIKWQDTNTEVEEENARLKERMEFMYENTMAYPYYEKIIEEWFTDKGKVK